MQSNSTILILLQKFKNIKQAYTYIYRMQANKTLVRIQSVNSLKVLNFAINIYMSLKQLRKIITNLQVNITHFTYLMPDKSPISKNSEDDIELEMILNQNRIFFVEEEEFLKNKGLLHGEVASDMIAQKQQTERAKIYTQLMQKAEQLKQRVKKIKQTYNEKKGNLKKIDPHYQGQINQFGIYQGIGKYTYPNNEVFIGEFKNGQRNGVGCFTFKNGDIYEGEYKNNQACGLGMETFQDGNKMIAVYKDNCSNGIGIYFYANGERLEGCFINNIFEGTGYRIFPDGTWKVQKYKKGYIEQN